MAKEQNSDFKVVTGEHRISYVHLKEPNAFEDGEAKYDVTLLIDKAHPDVERIKNAIRAAYEAEKVTKFNNLPLSHKSIWNPLRDGDDWLEEHPDAEEYAGVYFLKATSKSQPAAFDSDKNDIFDLDEVYSGCYVRADIRVFAFNQKGNRGTAFFLNSVMKMNDGERLGGFTASADDYDDAPAQKRNAPANSNRPTPKPAAPAKPAVEWAKDGDGNDIYSEDGGVNWFYPE